MSNWLKQDHVDSGRRTDGLTSDERSELTRLRREVKRLTIEQRDTLKSRGLVRSGDRYDSEEAFGFVRAYQACYAVITMCRFSKSPRAATTRGAIALHRRVPWNSQRKERRKGRFQEWPENRPYEDLGRSLVKLKSDLLPLVQDALARALRNLTSRNGGEEYSLGRSPRISFGGWVSTMRHALDNWN
jgi:hypothetical protein